MKRSVPLAVVLLVLAAGCTGATGPGGTAAPTNGSTNGATNTGAADSGGPGWLSANGSVNVSALLEANAARLRAAGFARTTEIHVSVGPTTHGRRESLRTTAGFARLRANVTTSTNGTATTHRVWANATTPYAAGRQTGGNETRYYYSSIGTVAAGNRTDEASAYVGTRRLASLLRGGSFTVDETTTNGTTRYVLTGSDFASAGPYGARNVTLTVDADGAVRRVNASGALANGGTFAYRARLTAVGVEDVARPDWVADAPAPVHSRPSLGFDNCSAPYLTLRNPGPDAVPAGSVVTVGLNGTTHRVTLDAALGADDRVALFLDASGDLRVTDPGDVPASRTAMPTEASATVRTAGGLVLSRGSFSYGCMTANATATGGSGAASGSSSGSASGSA